MIPCKGCGVAFIDHETVPDQKVEEECVPERNEEALWRCPQCHCTNGDEHRRCIGCSAAKLDSPVQARCMVCNCMRLKNEGCGGCGGSTAREA